MSGFMEWSGVVAWSAAGLLFGSLGLALVNGWRVERAERRAEAKQAHPSFTEHADQAIALTDDWRDEAGVYPVLTDAEIAAFWQANR